MAILNALLLADGRFPSGGHAHSGGLEAAVASGDVAGLDDLSRFLQGRLATAGAVCAALAAAACTAAHPWADLDAAADARMASPESRRQSRRQGRQLLRAAAAVWGGPATAALAAAAAAEGPHHATAIGAAASDAGLVPRDAASAAAFGAVTGPAGAAVRLLGLDPFAVHAVLAGLAGAMERIVTDAVDSSYGPLDKLPCASSPLLDLAAECHATRKERLFAS